MPSVFIDTNVLLYAARPALSTDEEGKRIVARGLIASEDFGLSGQVLAEFYHNAVKQGPSQLSEDEAVDWLQGLCEQPCAEVDASLVRDGVRVARRFQLSYWDGAIVAAAQRLGAKTLYTEDLNDGQRYGDVTAINPFKPSTH